jgi:hypothetical protein
MSIDDDFSVDAARAADRNGVLDTWVEEFLASDGSDNAELGRELSDDFVWFGPVEVPFDRLRRLAGPPDEPTLERLDGDDLDRVEDMADSIDDGWVSPPLVATWRDDHFRLEDGNHRVEALRRAGHDRYWCVVGTFDTAARRRAESELATD